MPSTSQSQEKFFNFVHATQTGEASAKGYPKVEEAAHEMKPSQVDYFRSGKHIDKSLPKTASYWSDMFKKLRQRKNPEAQPESQKQACDVCGCGEPHAYHEHDEYIKNKHMKKEAFDRGFMKAALENRVDPLLAVRLLKQASGMQDIMSAIEANPGMYGAIGGGLGGAGLGAMAAGKGHRMGGALSMGLGGAGLGYLAGNYSDPHRISDNAGIAGVPGAQEATSMGIGPDGGVSPLGIQMGRQIGQPKIDWQKYGLGQGEITQPSHVSHVSGLPNPLAN